MTSLVTCTLRLMPSAARLRTDRSPGKHSMSVLRSFPMRFFFFSSRRRHTRSDRDWSSDVCSSDLAATRPGETVSGSVVNVGAGARTSLLDLIELVGEITGRELTYQRLPAREGDEIGRASCRERV